MPPKRKVILIVIFSLLLWPGNLPAENPPAQPPIIVLGDVFRLVPGAWATYNLRNLKDDSRTQIYIAIEKRVKRKAGPAVWMEIEVKSEGQPGVVTRFLSEETKHGPGKPLEVIIQVEGLVPFKVPKKYYRGKFGEVGNFHPVSIVTQADKETLTYKGREVTAWKVEAADAKGQTIRAMVSDEIPPLGLISVETSETEMLLDDWGLNMKSKIHGQPMSLWLWVLFQMGNEDK